MEIPIFYPYKMSLHNELMYSLRSIEANFLGDPKVFLGSRTLEVPEWINKEEVTIFTPDLLPQDRYANTASKIYYFCKEISGKYDEFILFNDDHILLKPMSIDDIGVNYTLQDLSTCKSRGTKIFQKKLWFTYDLLKKRGFKGYSAACHVPFLFNVKKLLQIFKEFPQCLQGKALQKTAYLNYFLKDHGTPKLITQDIRIGIWSKKSAQEVENYSWGSAKYLNFNEDGWLGSSFLRDKVTNMFNKKSKFEV